MGIKGLLASLKHCTVPAHVSEFRGTTVGIDGYAWLHRAVFSDLQNCLNNEVSDRPVLYCIRRANIIKSYGVKPLFVFDGCSLPSKASTNKARRDNREAAKTKMDSLLATGDRIGARKAMRQAVGISSALLIHLLKALKKQALDFLIAPYEADAQLGYLSQHGHISATISEDSDLLLYGCQV